MDPAAPNHEVRAAIEAAVRASLKNGKLPCRKAFAIAAQHNLPPAVIGKIADALGIRISGCQLGCFP